MTLLFETLGIGVLVVTATMCAIAMAWRLLYGK